MCICSFCFLLPRLPTLQLAFGLNVNFEKILKLEKLLEIRDGCMLDSYQDSSITRHVFDETAWWWSQMRTETCSNYQIKPTWAVRLVYFYCCVDGQIPQIISVDFDVMDQLLIRDAASVIYWGGGGGTGLQWGSTSAIYGLEEKLLFSQDGTTVQHSHSIGHNHATTRMDFRTAFNAVKVLP
jgi:hypothetical protein